jgi:predicted transcriptional regulator
MVMDLRARIRERGLKQSWVADQIGVSRPSLSVYLSGKSPLPIDKLRPLAEALGLAVDVVLDDLLTPAQSE